MRKSFYALFLLLVFSVVYIELHEKKKGRIVASSDEIDGITIGELKISDSSSLVYLGVECKSHGVSCENWQEFGFKKIKGDLTLSYPKFLVLKNGGEIERVFAFEFGNTDKRGSFKALENKEGMLLNYIKFPSKVHPKLPKLLVDPLLVRKHRRPYSYFNFVNIAVSFTKYGPITRTIKEAINFFENKKLYQASYLNRLIQFAIIDEKLPELVDVIGRENLKDIGASLRIRYRGTTNDIIDATFSKRELRGDFYEEVERFRTEVQSVNMSKLVTRANEEGLVVVPYSRDMAILYYDPKVPFEKSHYRNLLLNTNLEKKHEIYNRIENENNKIIPLGVFFMSDKATVTKTIDFERPKIPLIKENAVNVIDYALTIGMSFIDSFWIGTAVKAGYFAGKLILKKKGKLFLASLLESEAHLEVLMNSGLVQIDHEEVSKDIFAYLLDEMDLDEDKQSYFSYLLNSENEEEVERGFKEVVLLYQKLQTGRRWSHGVKESYKLNNRLVASENLKAFIKSKDFKESMDKFLSERSIVREKIYAKEAKKRKPSSLEGGLSEAAVVFMIDGLRPDRLKEAYARGLVPTIGKHFIKEGLEFDSFAPRSLTLPSWSSILTGVDQDYHGLKSNGPMSRVLGSPNRSYTDPRKDILNYYFNKKPNNYAYDHLKESDRKWLPDFFKLGEVHTNYMPVNNAPFYKLGNLFKTVLKDFRKLLFGNFSGTVALDRVSAVEVVKKLESKPGETKLILNWYTCVDVFAHHNNKAIDTCYRELDKTVGMVIDGMKNDPTMKNANMFIISDHGHIGGNESEHSHFKLKEEGSYFNNTALNLTTLFAGDYNDYRHFKFNPFVFESPHPDNDLKFLSEYQIHPFKYKYKDKKQKIKGKKSDKLPDVLIDYSGDAMAQVYFKHKTQGWNRKLSLYELNNLKDRDVISDLLDIELKNNVNSDKEIVKLLEERNKRRPVFGIAHALSSCKHEDFEQMLGEKLPSFERPAVMIKGRDSDFGVILTKIEEDKMYYRYVLLSSLTQDSDSKCRGKVTSKPKDIFQDYYSTLGNKWYDRDELLDLFKKHEYPTALISLVGTLTLSHDLAQNHNRQQEIPDLVLYANEGFNFSSSIPDEADHGGLSFREVKDSFFFSKLGTVFSDIDREKALKKPVLNYYLTPFLLDVTGKERTVKEHKQVPSFFDYLK